MTAPLRPDKPITSATRFARKLQALARAECRQLGLKGQNARTARDELVGVALREIGQRLR